MKTIIEKLKEITKEDLLGGMVVMVYAAMAYGLIWMYSL